MKLIYSNMKADTKPSDARPYQKKTNYTFADVNIADAARLIGEGRAWRAGLYDNSGGSFKKQEVRGAQLIALDFDACPHEPQEIVNIVLFQDLVKKGVCGHYRFGRVAYGVFV